MENECLPSAVQNNVFRKSLEVKCAEDSKINLPRKIYSAALSPFGVVIEGPKDPFTVQL
jgi:hypothetical protein